MHDGLLEDLLVTNIGLDQSPEAGDNSIGLLVELEGEIQRHVTHEHFLDKITTKFTNGNLCLLRISVCFLYHMCV